MELGRFAASLSPLGSGLVAMSIVGVLWAFADRFWAPSAVHSTNRGLICADVEAA